MLQHNNIDSHCCQFHRSLSFLHIIRGARYTTVLISGAMELV